MKVKKVVCEFCNKPFHPRGIHPHQARCKSKNEPPVPQMINKAAETPRVDVISSQRIRATDGIINLTESIARLNNALATVVGEWRLN